MFMLTTLSDLVEIRPDEFKKRSAEAIEGSLNAKYANKVVPEVGLSICLFDLLKASEGHLGHGTGSLNVNVEFRLLVFRPFKGEIIIGKISSAAEWGMKIRLDFFDDILVPPNMLFDHSYFNKKEQCWIWRNDGKEYYYDKHEWVRVRVEREEWNHVSPVSPSESQRALAGGRQCPYNIIASMEQSALGPVIWW